METNLPKYFKNILWDTENKNPHFGFEIRTCLKWLNKWHFQDIWLDYEAKNKAMGAHCNNSYSCWSIFNLIAVLLFLTDLNYAFSMLKIQGKTEKGIMETPAQFLFSV